MSEIDLEVLQVGVRVGISDGFVNDVTLREERNVMMRMNIINAFMDMPGQKFDPVTISYPSDWWQAFKERWLPWLSARWSPVRRTTTTFNPNVYYPQLKLPDEQSFLHIERYDRTA